MKTNLSTLARTLASVFLCLLAAGPVAAQLAAPPPAPAYQPLSDQQLDQLLGPIALYPDPLLAEILPAATLPAQIVLADRYMAGGGDPNAVDQQPWDPSVQALTHYPTVLKWLDDNLAWTTEVGDAFLNQQQDVMDSIQRLRASAQNFGNLESTPQQQVVDDNGDIEILPAEPDVIYVPVYLPAYIYIESGYGPSFGVACAIGPWLNCDFDWINHDIRFWGRHHPRPANWWQAQPAQRAAWLATDTRAWQPANRRGAAAASRGDRGWNHSPVRPPQTSYNPAVTAAVPRQAPAPAVARESRGFQLPSQPAPKVNFSPAPNGAFIGSDSSRDARTFSERGQESLQTVRPPEPAQAEPPRAEPPPHSEPPPPPAPAPVESGGGHDSRR